MKVYLGIELGSTRIKSVAVDNKYRVVAQGSYGWKSDNADGIWTYSLDEAWTGLNAALKQVAERIDVGDISAMGISGMMHGYLAFDKEWRLLAPFRTWQNTITEEAAGILTQRLGANIPQRWSVAHLYQAILNGEAHVKDVAHITTLAGYIHHALTGENVVGIGEASGMFPIDSETKTYDSAMATECDALFKASGIGYSILDVLPEPRVAGSAAGRLVNTAAVNGLLPAGIRLAPPEGDVQTGMAATNSVAVGRGNISGGTSIFLTTVTGKKLKKVYSEVDVVTTPTGEQSVMIHANNCTNDINAWFDVLGEAARLLGGGTDDMYVKLFELSLKGDADCGGVIVYNYMAGEPITHVYDAHPIVIRRPDAKFTLANFVRAQLYGALATIRIGLELLEDEGIEIARLTGHGGYYKTPGVGQLYTAAACRTPVYCNSAAGEGGPFGMALLAAYTDSKKSLSDFLDDALGSDGGTVISADKRTQAGFDKYMTAYKQWFNSERYAMEKR